MTQPLIAQEYYEQIVNKFKKKYNSYVTPLVTQT